MSAYDNPTIIKDDSAMAWAQGIASFGENFSKARIARQELDLKEKAYEAKLKKETEENQIAMQSASIKQGLANQKEIGAAVDKIPTVDPVLTNQWKSQFAELKTKEGENNVTAEFAVLSSEQINANTQFAESVTQFKDKSLPSLAAYQTNVAEWSKLSPRERANTAFMGNTPLERKISEISLYASDTNNYNYKDKVSKNLYKEDNNPANPGLEIITKIDPAKDLKGIDQTSIDEGIKNGSILYDKDTNSYSVKFKQKLGTSTWDGTFYHKVAEAPDPNKIWGKDQANIVNDKGELNNNFIINPGNPVITKEKIKDFPNKEKLVETTYVNTPEIRKNAKMYYDAGAEALLSSDLRDMGQLQSFLQTKLNRGNESLEDWIKQYPTVEKQKAFISKRLFEIDMDAKLGGSSDQYSNRPATEADVKALRADKVGETIYYTQKATEVATPKAESSEGTGDDKPTAAEIAQNKFNDRIKSLISTKKGGVKVGKYTLSVIKGRWGLRDENGMPLDGTENITNPRELATYIGSTIPLLK
jgi:hypothetical protein